MPEDIYSNLWSKISTKISLGNFAVNKEIYDELLHLPGLIGECIKGNRSSLLLEVGDEHWNWEKYLAHVERMRITYKPVISEYNGNRKGTVGLNDVSIIALAICLNLPLVSMESPAFQRSETKIRIPGLCDLEGVQHLDFNQFLRAEGIKI
jgi:hypothetical protein